jgi:hypothetical protein
MAGSRLVHTLAKPRQLSTSTLVAEAEVASPVFVGAVARKIILGAGVKDPLFVP